MNHVSVALVATAVLVLAVTEAIVVQVDRRTNSSDFENCTESLRLVPTLQLLPRDRSSSLSPPTLATLRLPTMTTQPVLYTQPHATTHATTPHATTPHATTPHATTPHVTTPHVTTTTSTTTTTPTELKHKATPHLHKTPSSSPAVKKHEPLKEKETLHFEKPTTEKVGATYDSLDKAKGKTQTSKSYERSSHSSVSSSSFSTPPPSPIHATVPPPTHSPHSSTLPPPIQTLPLPNDATVPTTSTPTYKLPEEVWEKLKHLLGKHIPLALPSEWAQPFRKSYLERIRAVNHEMVDKLLQAEQHEATDTFEGSVDPCHLPEKRLAHLYYLRTVLVLLLQALPQSLEEVEEAAWNPEITDYIFRPERKAVFDVYGCRQCYALDASGVCRELFYCKEGGDIFSRTTRRRPFG